MKGEGGPGEGQNSKLIYVAHRPTPWLDQDPTESRGYYTLRLGIWNTRSICQ